MKQKVLIVFTFLVIIAPAAKSQGFFDRIKQKAKEVAGKAIDKSLDNMVNGKKNADAAPSPSQQPEPVKSDHVSYGNDITPTPVPAINYIKTDTLITGTDTVYHFNTSTINPKEFVAYAMTLQGTPYAYGSVDPAYGLDCSGFITHVFNHFGIAVPRRSYDFKNAENKVPVNEAKVGDLILFTGTDATQQMPGHMGIITAVGKDIQFVHAASGQGKGVSIAQLSYNYFKTRFLAVVRPF